MMVNESKLNQILNRLDDSKGSLDHSLYWFTRTIEKQTSKNIYVQMLKHENDILICTSGTRRYQMSSGDQTSVKVSIKKLRKLGRLVKTSSCIYIYI